MDQRDCPNHLLASLPPAVYTHWQADFEVLELQAGQVLNAPGQRISHVYFPLSAIVSWVYWLENGCSTEIAMTGREACIGIHLLLGNTTPHQARVQTAGTTIRLRADLVLEHFNSTPAVQSLFLRFTQTLLNQISLVAVCKAHHTVDQQLCRLMLMVLDRQDSGQLHMTHEDLSLLLGVRREAVSLAAARLMKEGLIHYARGHITVLDRAGLTRHGCDCHDALQAQDRTPSPRPLTPSPPFYTQRFQPVRPPHQAATI